MADKDEISPLIANGASDISESAENSESSSTYRGANIFLLITLSVSNFFAALSFSVLSPFFPGAAEAKGISLTLTGIIIGEFELMIFLSSPFVVHIAAHVGNRFVYICGLFICGTCSVLFGVLEYCPNGSTFAIMCLLTRGIGAFGGGIFLVSSFAILAHSFPDKVSTVTGIVEMALGLGYMVGPALGGAFYDLGGFRLPFFTVGGLVLLTAVAAYLITPALPRNPEDIIAFHFSSTIIGLIFLTPSLVYTLSAVLWGRLTDSMGWGIGVLIFGLIGCTIGVFFINPASFVLPIKPTLFTLLPALVLVGLGSSAVMIPVYGLCLDAAYANGMDENIATINLVSGVTNSAYSLGVFIGPTLGGRLYDTIGFDKLLFAYSGLFVVCAVLLGIARVYSRCTMPSQYSRQPSSY
uniref:MFS domain-containing protein n=1 Tax=Macrostomum lignano TaxID=282301 RepID=A0A1I8GUC6_9PLAT